MTNRNAVLLILLLNLTLQPVIAQNSGRTFSKNFNTENKGTILLNLPGAIDLKIWDNPTIKIEICVSLPSGNGGMLDGLVTAGRYNMSSKADGDLLSVLMPNMQKQIFVKGEELRETITFVVFMPKNLKVEMFNSSTTAPIVVAKE